MWNEVLTLSDIQEIYKVQKNNFTELAMQWSPQYSNMVGHWKLDGNLEDSTGNGNDGSAVGNLTFSANSKVGLTSTLFEGTTDYVQLGNIMPASYTKSAWINLDPTGGNLQNIFSNEVGQNHAFWLPNSPVCGSGYHLAAGHSNPWSSVCDPEEEPGNRWVHVAVTYDSISQDIILYKNGQIVDTGTDTPFAAGGGARIGAHNPVSNFKGLIDEVGLWSTVLTPNQIDQIYKRQKHKHFGHFQSQIIDTGSTNMFTELHLKMPIPFMKEITNQNEDNSNYKDINSDFMNGIIGHWKFNETILDGSPAEVIDSSGLNNNGVSENGTQISTKGQFLNSAKFDGVNDKITISDSPFDITGDMTLSGWVNIKRATNQITIAGKAENSAYTLEIVSGKWQFSVHDGISYKIAFSNLPAESNTWVHVLGVVSGTDVFLYVNGQKQISTGTLTGPISTNNENFVIGYNPPNSFFMEGMIDEVAIWERALLGTEILQLYRRGANQIKYQVRTCNDNSCDTEAWIGPDGTPGSYFSELHNNNLINGSGYPIGNVNPESSVLNFSNFVLAPASNRYFQYQIYFESNDDNLLCGGINCMPELESIALGPSYGFYSGAPALTTKPPIPYTKLSSISVSKVGTCTIEFQLSPNAVDYYYWNGTVWKLTTVDSNRNNLAELNAILHTFPQRFGLGSLSIKAFLNSSSAQSCELSSISIQ